MLKAIQFLGRPTTTRTHRPGLCRTEARERCDDVPAYVCVCAGDVRGEGVDVVFWSRGILACILVCVYINSRFMHACVCAHLRLYKTPFSNVR